MSNSLSAIQRIGLACLLTAGVLFAAPPLRSPKDAANRSGRKLRLPVTPPPMPVGGITPTGTVYRTLAWNPGDNAIGYSVWFVNSNRVVFTDQTSMDIAWDRANPLKVQISSVGEDGIPSDLVPFPRVYTQIVIEVWSKPTGKAGTAPELLWVGTNPVAPMRLWTNATIRSYYQ